MAGRDRLRAFQQRKYLWLLVALLSLAALEPLVKGTYVGRSGFNLLFCLVLAAGIFALSQRRRTLLFALILGIPALGVTWGNYLPGEPSSRVYQCVVLFRFAAHLAFLIYAVLLILYEVMQVGRVTADRLRGAICVYLLLGLIWAVLYSMIEYSRPGAFVAAGGEPLTQRASDAGYRDFSILVYYSYVTLTTLGYGDVAPVSPVARTFSWLEAVTGQVYLAVLIARLVGLHIAQADSR